MVTAASETVDREVGLETGADDYIARRFSRLSRLSSSRWADAEILSGQIVDQQLALCRLVLDDHYMWAVIHLLRAPPNPR